MNDSASRWSNEPRAWLTKCRAVPLARSIEPFCLLSIGMDHLPEVWNAGGSDGTRTGGLLRDRQTL
jgi:hypothetical protein